MATTPTTPTAPDADPDEDRARFLAALEAKKHRSGHGSNSQDASGGPVKEHSGKSGGKREFRRKSGG
jgi:hypothetical protein